MKLKLNFILLSLLVVFSISVCFAQDYEDSMEGERDEESPTYPNVEDEGEQNEEIEDLDNNLNEEKEKEVPEKPMLVQATSEQIQEVEDLEENVEEDNDATDDTVFQEGDMKVDRHASYSGLINPNQKWPKGVIPYEFSHGFSRAELDVIYSAMWYLSQYTCIRFTPRKYYHQAYVQFKNNEAGCWADLGRGDGRRRINLDKGCLKYRGIIIVCHEIMHSLGIVHEQTRGDRQSYVRILHENIISQNKHNFDNTQPINPYGVPYDYTSIMHYGNYAFSKNGKPTIEVVGHPQFQLPRYKLGDRDRLSGGDVRKINNMYNHCR